MLSLVLGGGRWLNDVSSTKTIGRLDVIYSNRLNVQLAKHRFLKCDSWSIVLFGIILTIKTNYFVLSLVLIVISFNTRL